MLLRQRRGAADGIRTHFLWCEKPATHSYESAAALVEDGGIEPHSLPGAHRLATELAHQDKSSSMAERGRIELQRRSARPRSKRRWSQTRSLSMAEREGVEPLPRRTTCFRNRRPATGSSLSVERPASVELALRRWQRRVLP